MVKYLLNFKYEPEKGYSADAIDGALSYEKIFLDYYYGFIMILERSPAAPPYNHPNLDKLCSVLNIISNEPLEIVVTNIQCSYATNNIFECFVDSFGQSELTLENQGQLIRISTISHAHSGFFDIHRVYNILKMNKNSWYKLYPLQLLTTLGFAIYFDRWGRVLSANTNKEITSLVFEDEECHSKLNQCWNSIGYYNILSSGALRYKIFLHETTHNPLGEILPAISIDLETIAKDACVVPIGVSEDEKISSLVMQITYNQISLYICLYLGLGLANDEAFEKSINQKIGKSGTKYLQSRFIRCHGEEDLLEKFVEWYMNGLILKSVFVSEKYPHLLIGHNILNYDLPFILRRLIFFKKWDSLNRVIINHEYTDLSFPKFHPNAITLDTMLIAKRNMLSDKFALKDLAKKFLTDQKITKMDLDSVTIRRVYNLCEDAKKHNNIAALQALEAIQKVSTTVPVIEKDNYNFTDMKVKILNFTEVAFSSELESYNKIVPTLEQILFYNIQDTITVTEIIHHAGIFTLLINLVELFRSDVEIAAMFGNSHRLQSSLIEVAFKSKIFLGANHKVSTIYSTPQKKYQLPSFSTADKGYKGAFNYAKPAYYKQLESFDFSSYYPNLLKYLNIDYGNCIVISGGNVQKLEYDRLTLLRECMEHGLVSLYRMEDPKEVEAILVPGYRGREIGEEIHPEKLSSLKSSEPFLMKYTKVNSVFFKTLIESLIIQRKEAKKNMAATKDPILRGIFDSRQLGIKIILNSMYGVLGAPSFIFSHLPISASITLFGRKFLTVCSRVIVCYYALMSKLCTDAEINFYKAELEYLKSSVVSYRRIPNKFPTPINSFQQLITYVDTDGIKFRNDLNLDPKALLLKVNQFLEDCACFGLAFEAEKTLHDTLIMTKKKYASVGADGTVFHVGYERHANPVVKRILTNVVLVCARGADHNPTFILFDVFGWLNSVNPLILVEKIKLNYHQNDSSLKRYIDSITQDYKGDIATVLLLNKNNFKQDLYMSLEEWRHRPHLEIHLGKVLRRFSKILLRFFESAAHRYSTEAMYSDPEYVLSCYEVWYMRFGLEPLQETRKFTKYYHQIIDEIGAYVELAKNKLPLAPCIDANNIILLKRKGVQAVINLMN